MSNKFSMTRLKIAIDASGLKQRWLAKEIGIDPSLLSRYVGGYRPTPPGVVKALAKVLKVKQSDLV